MNRLLLLIFFLVGLRISAQQIQLSCLDTVVYSTPFYEDCDSLPWWPLQASSYPYIGKFDTGWCDTRNDSIRYKWYVSDYYANRDPNNLGPSGYTGPKHDFTGRNFLTTVYTYHDVDSIELLAMPYFDIQNLLEPEFRFWFYMYGQDINRLVILGREFNRTWQRLDSLVGEFQSGYEDIWKEYYIPLQGLGDTIQIAFMAIRNTTGPHAAISLDAFSIDEKPTCQTPLFIEADSVGTTIASIGFAKGGDAAHHQMLYGRHGFTFNQGIAMHAYSDTNNFRLDDLKPGLTYDGYIRDSCSATDQSDWVGPVFWTQACDTVFGFPFFEDFDDWNPDTIERFGSENTISTCWQNMPRSYYEYRWQVESGAKNSASRLHALHDKSGNGLFIISNENSNSTTNKELTELTSPKFDLGSSVNPVLSFWYYMYGVHPCQMITSVVLKDTILAIDTLDGPTHQNDSALWWRRIIDVSSFKFDTIQIHFSFDHTYRGASGLTSTDVLMSIDEFALIEKPGCAVAGEDTALLLCDSLYSVALGSYLDSMAYGGSWHDLQNSGALSPSGLLDLTLVPLNLPYRFRYTIPADGDCPADSITFTVERSRNYCHMDLAENGLPEVLVFPNPAKDKVYIETSQGDAISKIELFDLNGQELPISIKKREEGVEVSLVGLSPGTYFLKAEIKGQNLYRKVMVH